jgi:hypothetical protein
MVVVPRFHKLEHMGNNSTLLYEFYKTPDCDRCWLGHDERSEECSNRTSVTVRLIKRVEYTYYFFYFSTLI